MFLSLRRCAIHSVISTALRVFFRSPGVLERAAGAGRVIGGDQAPAGLDEPAPLKRAHPRAAPSTHCLPGLCTISARPSRCSLFPAQQIGHDRAVRMAVMADHRAGLQYDHAHAERIALQSRHLRLERQHARRIDGNLLGLLRLRVLSRRGWRYGQCQEANRLERPMSNNSQHPGHSGLRSKRVMRAILAHSIIWRPRCRFMGVLRRTRRLSLRVILPRTAGE